MVELSHTTFKKINIVSISFLVTVGILINLSASSVIGLNKFNDNFHFIKRHVGGIILGLIIYNIGKKFSKDYYKKLAYTGMLSMTAILFFSALLIVGILIFDDYGMSWDEYHHRANGFVSLNYIRSLLSLNTYSGFPNLENYIAREYGVIFDLPMAYLEKLLLIEDSKNYFLMRHLTNFFIFFISCICFYLLLIKRFTYKLSMLGLLGDIVLAPLLSA